MACRLPPYPDPGSAPSRARTNHGYLLEVARHMLAFTNSLNTHFLLYSRRCCMTLFQHGNAALTGCSWLAEKSLPLNVCAFALVPKVHMVKHTVVELQDALQWTQGLLLSPMTFACETNEDVIGKICRLSSRTDGRTMEKRVLEMYLTKAFLLHKRAMARLELWEKACKPWVFMERAKRRKSHETTKSEWISLDGENCVGFLRYAVCCSCHGSKLEPGTLGIFGTIRKHTSR